MWILYRYIEFILDVHFLVCEFYQRWNQEIYRHKNNCHFTVLQKLTFRTKIIILKRSEQDNPEFYKTLILLELLHGSETWTVTSSQTRILETAKMELLKRIKHIQNNLKIKVFRCYIQNLFAIFSLLYANFNKTRLGDMLAQK